MNSRSDITLSLATPDDSAGIQAVFDSMSFSGGISVRFARSPDPYRSLQLDGERAAIAVLRDRASGERIIGVGACVVRKEFLRGALAQTGYLTGMKLLPEYRGRALPIAAAYRLLRQSTPEVSLYYTTILKENTAAQALLEKRRRTMPVYDFQGMYRVYCIGAGTRGKTREDSEQFVECGSLDGLEAFYGAMPAWDFSCSFDFIRTQPHCQFFTLRGANRTILAACAVWNQQEHKQYIVERYGGIYNMLRRLPLHVLGYPRFPKPGCAANYASIALLRAKNDDAGAVAALLRAVAARTQYELLFVGLSEENRYRPVLERIPHIAYESRFYTVLFDGAAPEAYCGFAPEVGLL